MTAEIPPTGGLICHIYFSLGRCPLELAQGPSRVALALHLARGSAPFGVTSQREAQQYRHVSLANTKIYTGAYSLRPQPTCRNKRTINTETVGSMPQIFVVILAEGAMTLPVTLSGGVLFAS